MNFETLFEEIESNLAATHSTRSAVPELKKYNQLQLEIFDSTTHHLVAPIIGADFYAGLDENSVCWFCIPFANVRRATFAIHLAGDLPGLRRQDVSLEQFIAASVSHSVVSFQVRGQLPDRAMLKSVAAGQLWLEETNSRAHAVAIASLDWIKILDITDSAELSEWLER